MLTGKVNTLLNNIAAIVIVVIIVIIIPATHGGVS